MILVDWEKAFDKVRQDNVIETLKRLIVPPKIVTWSQVFTKALNLKAMLVNLVQHGHRNVQVLDRAAL